MFHHSVCADSERNQRVQYPSGRPARVVTPDQVTAQNIRDEKDRMKPENNTHIPEPVIKRYSSYLMYLERLSEEGSEWVSSRQIADDLQLTSSTVRHDLSYLAFSGICKRGYETEKLEGILQETLGADKIAAVAIVGGGNLGRALALHLEDPRKGFQVRAVFDSNTQLVGKPIGELLTSPMNELTKTVKNKKIRIGAIAVPPRAAQKVADKLVNAGVQGILNLTPVHVNAPGKIPVVNARILANLQRLAYLMKNNKKKTTSETPSRKPHQANAANVKPPRI